MQISVVGAGYVGLVTAACFARLGNDVRVLEIDPARVERLRRGELPIHEPGLDELVADGLASRRLSFDTDPASLHGTRLAIVAVGTLDRDGEWTDRTVRATVDGIARDPKAPRAIVIRSTLLPGSAVAIRETALAIHPGLEIAFNPEFTRESTAVNDFLMPDRVVIGVSDPHRADSAMVDDLRRLYAPLEAPIVVTDLTSAEMIKVASNVFLASKITFANELARLCAAAGADVAAVVDGMGLDKRIGRSFLSPGPGFGGSCFPSQARALPGVARRLGVKTRLIDSIDPSNEDQADWLIDRLELVAGRSIKGWRIGLLGLTFKAGTDDLRESPAIRLARRLVARGASVAAFDPAAGVRAVAELAADGFVIEGCASAQDACADADAVVVATEWPEFRQLDWGTIAPRMQGRLVADARHVVDIVEAGRAGLQVLVLGVTVPQRGPTGTA
jgi:UDPglucose 6-dehydrogenase